MDVEKLEQRNKNEIVYIITYKASSIKDKTIIKLI